MAYLFLPRRQPLTRFPRHLQKPDLEGSEDEDLCADKEGVGVRSSSPDPGLRFLYRARRPTGPIMNLLRSLVELSKTEAQSFPRFVLVYRPNYNNGHRSNRRDGFGDYVELNDDESGKGAKRKRTRVWKR